MYDSPIALPGNRFSLLKINHVLINSIPHQIKLPVPDFFCLKKVR